MSSNRISGVYCMTCSANGKRYIGSSSHIKKRWQTHRSALNGGTHNNEYLQRAWTRYGATAFEFSVLEECPEALLIERETWWIAHWGTDGRPHGFNLLPPDRHTHAPETRAKLSASHLGHVPWNKGVQGGVTWMKGRQHTPESRAKMSASSMGQPAWNKGQSPPPEVRAKISAAKKGAAPWIAGRTHGEAALAKMSTAKRGKAPWNKGRPGPPASPETRAKMAAAQKGKVFSELHRARLAEAARRREADRKRAREASSLALAAAASAAG